MKMCSCLAPELFLKNIEEYGLPHIPSDLHHLILKHTKSFTKCKYCYRVVAQSKNSECKIHCKTFMTCINCSKICKNKYQTTLSYA